MIMAAVGTRELTKYINERGMKLWEVKLVIPTGTTGITIQSQNIGVNGSLQSITIKPPNLDTDTIFQLLATNALGQTFGTKAGIGDNHPCRVISAGDLMYSGDKESGMKLPIFSDDSIQISFATIQAGGSLDFEVFLRGT